MLIRADSRAIPLPDRSVQAVVTSPPYLKQRVYGTNPHGLEIGLDDTLAGYVTTIADVFDEVRRVLDPRGFAWLNLGDKANGSGGAGGDWHRAAQRVAGGLPGPGKFHDRDFEEATYLDVPGAVLAELLRRGWRLRLPIVWDKGRESPEALRHVKRPRWSHEMIFLLSPAKRTRRTDQARPRWYPSMLTETGSVWHFPPGGSGPAHLAPFPDELARRCILPTSLPGDLVLDPFDGSGTTRRVAGELGRVGIGLDLYAGRPDLQHGRDTSPRTGRGSELPQRSTTDRPRGRKPHPRHDVEGVGGDQAVDGLTRLASSGVHPGVLVDRVPDAHQVRGPAGDRDAVYVDDLKPGDEILFARQWHEIATIEDHGPSIVWINFTDGSHLVDHADGAVYRRRPQP